MSEATTTTATYNLEAEEALLGSVLISPTAYNDVAHITSADFFIHKHRWVWDAITALHQQNKSIDVITVVDELARQKTLVEVGGTAFLARLMTHVPSSLHVVDYADTVRENATRRRVMELATSLARTALQPNRAEFLHQVNAAIETLLALQTSPNDMQTMSEIASEFYDQLQRAIADPDDMAGMKTGLADLDAALDFVPGELIVLPGESGLGKTILALQWGQAWAQAGYTGAVYELELSTLQIFRRMVSTQSRVTVRKLRRGDVRDSEVSAIMDSILALSQLDIHISDKTHWNTVSLRASLARLQYERGIRWFVLDYFDLLQDFNDDANLRDTLMARNLRNICKDLRLCGVVVHTLNKSGQASGSNKILYAADNVIYVERHPSDTQLVRLRPGKVRDDVNSGVIDLVRLPDYPAFGNLRRLP